MSPSDIERTLAEARAAAARRLGLVQPAPPEPPPAPPPGRRPEDIVARRGRADAAAAGGVGIQPAPALGPQAVVDLRPGPGHLRADSIPAAAPEPLVARAHPAVEAQGADLENVVHQPYQPEPGPEYIPVDPVARTRLATPEPAAQPLVAPPNDVVDYGEGDAAGAREREKVAKGGFAEIAREKALAGLAAWRRSRAERRARQEASRSETAFAGEAVGEARPQKQKLTEKERRWERRRRRYIFEEILGWIVVPIILVALYFLTMWLLDLFGTTPEAILEGLQLIWSQLG